MTENEISYEIIGAAIEVYRILGPGLLESAYEECLCYELKQKGFHIDQQLWLPLHYKDVIVKKDMYRLDIWVERKVIVDVKSVEQIPPAYFSLLIVKCMQKKQSFSVHKNKSTQNNFCALSILCPVWFRLVRVKQVRSYLQLTGSKLGLLLNFNVPVLKDGIHRIVLGLEE